MAVKLVHTAFAHELRFANRDSARHYAHENGGIDVWHILPAEHSAGEVGGRPAVLNYG